MANEINLKKQSPAGPLSPVPGVGRAGKTYYSQISAAHLAPFSVRLGPGNAPVVLSGRTLHHGGQLGVRGLLITGQYFCGFLQNGVLRLLVFDTMFMLF